MGNNSGKQSLDQESTEMGNISGKQSLYESSTETGENSGQQSLYESSTVKVLDINYLKHITKNFSEDRIIGSGGYGTVYKGEKENGELVAVKKIVLKMDDKQFMNEAIHVMDICHANIVRLEGYCYNTETKITFHKGRNVLVDELNRLLCFEYVPNGCLDDYLSDETSGLDWHTRYNIIKGICAGLYCLHEGREGAHILHLDLKPSNILLGKNMVPKIADFGLSRLLGGGKTHTSSQNIIGTSGYMPPEYIDSNILSKESDIFSLGVIIIQILTGQRKYPQGTSNAEFTEVYEKWRTRLQTTTKSTSWKDECRQVDQCIGVGRKCMDPNRKIRPNIREIVETLERVKCSEEVIGIDLGMDCSCVGVWRDGRVQIVADDKGYHRTPSCVAFTNVEMLRGDDAYNQWASNASNTVYYVKKLIGQSFSDATVQRAAKSLTFEVEGGADDKPLIKVCYLGEEKRFSPEEISAMILVKMKETAEAYVGPGKIIRNVVITVPAYFNSSQREATKDATTIAGLKVMHMMDEPIAAAMAYRLDMKWSDTKDSIVLVYDLGDWELDVSLLCVNKGVLQVKATTRDTQLGRGYFPDNMVEHFINEFKKKNETTDIISDKKALGRLRNSCDQAMWVLMFRTNATVQVEDLFEGVDFKSSITRDQFEKLNEELFYRCMEPIAKCLMDAKMDKNKVDDVVFVGSATRIPRVHQLVKEFFNGKEPHSSIDVSEVVAYGATVQAAILMGAISDGAYV